MDPAIQFINSNCDINIIISKESEYERHQYLSSYFKKHPLNVKYHNVSYDQSFKREHVRAMNYLSVVKSCKDNKKHFFVIIESDCLFMINFIQQLYNVCMKLITSPEVKTIVNFSKFENFASTFLLYTTNCLNNLDLTVPSFTPDFNYYRFLNRLRGNVPLSRPHLILSGNFKVSHIQSIIPGTKNTRFKKSFDVDERFDRFFMIYPKDKPVKQKVDLEIKDSKSVTDEFKQFIKKTYFICHPENEKEKHEYITKFTNEYFKDYDYKICCPTWGNTLKESDMNKFVGYNRTKPGVMSLVMNYITIMKEIASNNPSDNEHFMIVESDSLFVKDFIGICKRLIQTINSSRIDYDYIDLGNGMGYFPARFGYDITEKDYSLYLTNKMRCTGGIIYKFSCMKKIIEYFDQTRHIQFAIDELYDNLASMNKLKIYWLYPSIVVQGSQNGLMNSTIQPNDVIWDATNYDLITYSDDKKSDNNYELEWEIDDSQNIKLTLDSKTFNHVVSNVSTTLTSNQREFKIRPLCISTEGKFIIHVKCDLGSNNNFEDTVEL
jgi:hypothetical protein